jgi:hypothetical protein
MGEMKMNSKILVGTTATLALLALFLMALSPVMAITKAPYWEHVEAVITGPPDKQWLANGILHIEELPFSGSYEGTLGTGTMDVIYEHLTMNTATGKGTCIAIWTITIGENTMSGSANGKIIGGLGGTSEGVFRGTHGTGEFEHIEKMGTYSLNLATGTLEAEGVIIYH